jgi:membrane protein YdbS with pleckstrin-like domain
VFRASPKFLRYRLLGVALLFAVAVILGLVLLVVLAASRGVLGALAGVVIASALLALPLAGYALVRIDYEVRHYVFTDRSLRLREGAWRVREMTLTFANVQNLKVTQGPLQRLFGIADLEVHTAGGGGGGEKGHERRAGAHTLVVAGVENAHELRDRVAEHLRERGGDSGLGDPDEEHGTAPSSAAWLEALSEVRDAARSLRRAAELGSAC